MKYDDNLIIALVEVLTPQELSYTSNRIRRILEDKLDDAKKNVIEITVSTPISEDIVICKEDVNQLTKIQRAYSLFMESLTNQLI